MIESDARPVWQRETLFPEKPSEAPYGYWPLKGQMLGFFSFEELRASFEDEEQPIVALWTPETHRLVPVAEVPELIAEMKKRRLRDAKFTLHSKRTTAFLLGGLLLFSLYQSFRYDPFWQSPTLGISSIIFVIFGLIPLYEAWKSMRSAKTISFDSLREESREVRFERWIHFQKSYVTHGLMGAIIIVAVLQVFYGTNAEGVFKSVELLGLDKQKYAEGETGRLLSSSFLHGFNVPSLALHLFMNMVGLKFLGKRVENLARWPHLLMAYSISVLIGAYCSVFTSDKLSVGASGGIMGLLGFLLVFELMHPKLAPKPARRRLIAAIIFTFIMGLAGFQFIDNGAHFGGLLAGSAYAFLVFPASKSAQRPKLNTFDYIIGFCAVAFLFSVFLMTAGKLI